VPRLMPPPPRGPARLVDRFAGRSIAKETARADPSLVGRGQGSGDAALSGFVSCNSMICLHKASNSAYVTFMSILLRCDICGRTTAIPRLTGSGRLDLRLTGGWWLIGAGDADAVVACSEMHLHEVLAERNRHPMVTCVEADESCYA
jgi:hypothetical protein